MNKQQQIKKLAWKYFWQQKWKEITNFWEEGGTIIAIFTFVLGGFLQTLWTINDKTGLPMWKTGAIIGLCIMAFWILVLLRYLIWEIINWLKSNWKKALKKAKKEVKRRV